MRRPAVYHTGRVPGPENLDALADLVAALADGRPAPPAPAESVRRHRLAPLAYRAGRSEYRDDFVMSSLRAEQQRAIAAEAVDALVAAGIQVALLKGISYAGWLYADPGERPMTDVDLLVPLIAHDRATEVLGRAGYQHDGIGAQRSSRHHAITLRRGGGSVDLHRSPIQLGRATIDFAGVWSRACPAPWVPGSFRLETVDEILFHVAHLARHELIAPLLAYVDAGRMLRRLDPSGWATLLERAQAWRFRRVLERCLAVIEHVIGWRPTPGPWWLPRKIEVLRGDVPSRPVQVGRKLMLVEGPGELVRFVASLADGLRVQYLRPPR